MVGPSGIGCREDRYISLEVGISKLKGLALADNSTVHKEEALSWHNFRQHLIEQYSNVPYVPDTMFPYCKISQQNNESTTWYLVRAKVLLERIHQIPNCQKFQGMALKHIIPLWPLGTSYKEVGCKGAGILAHNGRLF